MKRKLAFIALATAGTMSIAPAVGSTTPTAPAPAAAATTSAPAPTGAETKISGPKTAKVGQEFKITGTTDKNLKGSKVYVYQDGKKIAAERTVSATGDISMRIVSGKGGRQSGPTNSRSSMAQRNVGRATPSTSTSFGSNDVRQAARAVTVGPEVGPSSPGE